MANLCHVFIKLNSNPFFISNRLVAHLFFILFTFILVLICSESHAYASPSVTTFGWYPAVVETNQPTRFKWDVKNVQSCTSLVSGAKNPSGTIGPVQWAAPRESTTKWYCTDFSGNRYPSAGYLTTKLSVVHPKPKVKRFSWSPSITTTGQRSYFYWNVENVSSCTSTVSGAHPINGRLGPYTFYEPRDSTTKWYCTDLNGDRYPTSGYLTARHKVDYPLPKVNKFEWSHQKL